MDQSPELQSAISLLRADIQPSCDALRPFKSVIKNLEIDYDVVVEATGTVALESLEPELNVAAASDQRHGWPGGRTYARWACGVGLW